MHQMSILHFGSHLSPTFIICFYFGIFFSVSIFRSSVTTLNSDGFVWRVGLHVSCVARLPQTPGQTRCRRNLYQVKSLSKCHEYLIVIYRQEEEETWDVTIWDQVCEGVNRPDYMVAMHLKDRVIDLANKPEWRQLLAIVFLPQWRKSGVSHRVASEIYGFNVFPEWAHGPTNGWLRRRCHLFDLPHVLWCQGSFIWPRAISSTYSNM